MWCEILEIGGITKKTCQRWMQDETTTCGHCKGHALSPYPDPTPVCGCGLPGNHPAMCGYRKSFFDEERQATDQEKTYVRGMLAGLSKRAASGVAGSKPHALDTPATRKFLSQVLDEAGVTDERVAEKVREGMDATMAIKLRNETGAEELVEVQDNTNQFRYTELAVKIKGGIAEKGQLNVKGNVTIVNQFSRNMPPSDDSVIDITPEQMEESA